MWSEYFFIKVLILSGAANSLASFFRNNFIIKSDVNENIFYQELDRKEYAVN